jgi:ElaB/YqjD/DUF883 family membrane-anchored ribosome-binding protein
MDQSNVGEDVRRSAESTVATIADQAQQAAEAHVSTQKDQAAGALHSVAEAVRRSSDELRDEQPQIASLATQAAERVDMVSDYIRDHNVRDFVRTAEDFARREPLIFVGSAFALGFLASRFIKASSPSRDVTGGNGDWRYSGGSSEYSGYGGYGSYGGEFRASAGSLQAGSYQRDRSLGVDEAVGASSGYQTGDYATGGSYMADEAQPDETVLDEEPIGDTHARTGA